MKVNEFVKRFGWDAIQGVIANADTKATHIKVYEHDTILIDYIHWDSLRISLKQNGEWVKLSRKYQNAPDFICIADLKRIIENHDYIESLGGYQFVKDNLPSGYFGDGDYKDLIKKCLEDMEIVNENQD